jgi:radical SAM protein with 4Fe4S-binding SPASM domain
MNEPKGTMELSLFEDIIEQCSMQKRLWMFILHNFGEPLLNPSIARMVSMAKERNIARSIQFATNGLLLTESKARDLIEAGLDGIVFSVDAYSGEEYKALKGKDMLDKVVENARTFIRVKKELKSSSPHVCAKMVRRKGYEHTFEPFLKMWSEIVDEAALTSFSNWGAMVGYDGSEEIPTQRYACHFLWYYPAINWDGRVFFCCAACDADAVIGDLRESSLSDIWHGERLAEVRRAHLEGRFDKIAPCSKCSYWSESRVNLDKWLLKRTSIS